MKEYEYSIIRRVSRNPKRNREGRGVSESDLEALRQELAGDQHATVTTIREGLELADTTAEDLRKRLGSAEEELKKKLGSEDFSKWREKELEPSLAGKASTVDVKQSAQQAIAEAIKRAGEMDKQIKVGGRNLIVTSRWKAGYLYGDRDDNAYPVGSENYKVLVGYDTFRFDPVYIPTLGESKVTYKLYDNGGSKNGTVQIHAYDKDKKFLWWSVDGWNGTIGHTNAWTLPTDTAYIRLGVTNENVRAKVEFGTVATDWTPAPEDVAESVSKVNTSVTDLTRTLLDPEQGEIHKLADIIGKHKKDTDKNFDDLANHPLTIDKDGLWQVWDVRKQKYVTTQYPSRGQKGDKGEDAGRYLGRAKRIHPDFNGNYLLEKEDSWRTAKEGDYVYLVGDAPNRGGDKDTFYIVREHKSNTVWEVYDIKGRKVSIEWHGTSLVIDNQPPVDLRGEPGHSPSADDVLETTRFADLLGVKVTEQVKPVSDKVDDVSTRVSNIGKNTFDSYRRLVSRVDDANKNISALQDVALTTDQKRDLGYLTGSIRALMSSGSGTEQTLEGLMLQRFIGLSGNNKDISAYLASYPLDAVLKAGITDFGTPNEREQVAINHNGTGHFGNLYFAGNQIDFRTSMDADPYLSIGADDMVPIADFVRSARVDDTPISTSSIQLTTSNKVYQRTVDVADDGTRLTITIDELLADCYDLDYAVLTLDGSNLASWQGDSKLRDDGQKISGGGGKVGFIRTPREWQNLAYERVVSKGRHTVRLELIAKSGQVTFTRFKVKRRYDTGRQQSLLTRSGLRLFGSPDRYLDVDYTPTEKYKLFGQELTRPNPYIVRIVGGAQIDELDIPGVPLCGATFDESGSSINSFGARAKQRGGSVAQAYRAYNADFYRVYHSIGHKRYIPVLQVYGLSNGNYTQCLTTRIDAIESDSFAVRIVTSGNVSIKHSFSYVAFKTTD